MSQFNDRTSLHSDLSNIANRSPNQLTLRNYSSSTGGCQAGRRRNPLVRLTMLIGLTLGLGITGTPGAFAQSYVPPDRGLPGRREGGGTRGDCVTSQPTLTALMPKTNYGRTTQARPTFFWYVPQTAATSAEFELLDENDNELYTAQFQIAEPGIIRISFPATASLSALSVGKTYHWYFSIICNAQDRSGDVITEGWVERVEPDAALTNRLEQAAEGDRATIYAEAGIWYDALDALAELRQAEPNRLEPLESWRHLLNSVDLGGLADKSLVSCCDQLHQTTGK